MFRVFLFICTISFLLGCSNENNSKKKESAISSNKSFSDTTKKIDHTNQSDKEAEQNITKNRFDSLYFYFKNYRYGNNPAYAYDLSEYLLEDGIKMLPSSHTDENHFFKFEDMEMIWITSNNIHNNYRLIIQDKSGHKNMFPDCRINCNNLMNIYYSLNAFLNTKIPNCKTLFEIEQSYKRELAANNEFILKLQKSAESAKTHNEIHIQQNLFESNCEFCKKEKSSYFSSPSAFGNLQRYFKNWINVQNKNFNNYDNSRELSELKIFGISWKEILSFSYRADGSPVSYRDTKSGTSKNIQKYILTIKNIQGLTRDYQIYFTTENDVARSLILQMNEYLKKFKKRQPVNTEIKDLRY